MSQRCHEETYAPAAIYSKTFAGRSSSWPGLDVSRQPQANLAGIAAVQRGLSPDQPPSTKMDFAVMVIYAAQQE
jgi:hypothetical protein